MNTVSETWETPSSMPTYVQWESHKRGEKEAESLFEEIMANKVKNLVNIINLPIYKS